MDERTVLPAWQGRDTGDDPVVVHRYRLGLETGVCVRSTGNGWWCDPERSAGGTGWASRVGRGDQRSGPPRGVVTRRRLATLQEAHYLGQ